jgi:tetratricopeptide (TPR) repeat protein/transcriptional regulator with XRE-family HTH domain
MATPQPLAFGQLLRRYRAAAQLTQAQLGALSGVSARTISDLERGLLRTPYHHTIESLAHALQLEPHERARFEAAARRQRSPEPPMLRQVSPAQMRSTLPPLVGRVRELSLLERHLRGEGSQLLLLAGEPGIGKTRLLRETAALARDWGWMVLEGGCQRRGGQGPYAPLVEALAKQLAQQTPTQQRAHLHGCAWLVRLLPELAATAVMPAPTGAPLPEDERRLMFAAVRRYVANVAGPAGTLLLLDDLQWAGDDALDLLAALIGAESERPLRVIGAYRSTEVGACDPLAALLADLAREGQVHQITLDPLAQQEALQLLTHLLTGATLPRAIRVERLVQFTGGVPFFLVSCAHGLHTGAFEAETEDPATLGVPWNVAQTIRQRVAALPSVAQEILNVAAVMGRMVPGTLLARVTRKSEDAVLEGVEAVCRARLLVENDADTYQFAHDLIHEVVVSALSTRRRKLLHQRVAEALEAEPGEPAVELLAFHCLRSGHLEKAIVYLERAGDQALAAYGTSAAAGFYREVVEQAQRLRRGAAAARAREKLAKVLWIRADYDHALDLCDRVTEEYRTLGDGEGVWRALELYAEVCGIKGTPECGLARLEPLLGALASSAPSPGLAGLYRVLAFLYFRVGRVAESLETNEHALELARLVGDDAIRVRAQFQRGMCLLNLGRQAEGARALEENMPLAEASGDLLSLSAGLCNLGEIQLMRGELAHARAWLERAVEVAERLGDPTNITGIMATRGHLDFCRGEWALARADFTRAASLSPAGSSVYAARPLLNLAELCMAQGQREEAVSHLQAAVILDDHDDHDADSDVLRAAHCVLAEPELLAGQLQVAAARLRGLPNPSSQRAAPDRAHVLLAWANLELGNLGRAETEIDRIIAYARREPDRLMLVEALRVLARVRMGTAQWQLAAEAVAEACSLAHAMPHPYGEAKSLYVYGQLHVAWGKHEQARERWEAARAICHWLGEGLYRLHIERALAGLT